MIDFWIDFLPKLAPFWDPSWDPRAAQDGPKTPPQNLFKLSKTPPGQLKSHKSIQDRNLVHFWSQNPMGYPPGPRFSKFLARLNSNFGAKFALGNLERNVRRRLGYGTPYAKRSPSDWRGGSNAQRSCVPATALSC